MVWVRFLVAWWARWSSWERVGQLETKALAKLRQPSRAGGPKDYLGGG